MNNFWDLVKFEYKKIFIKRSAWIALGLFAFVTVFSCFGVLMGDEYVDGVPVRSHYDSMKIDREYERALSGREIDADIILEASKAYQKVPTVESIRYTESVEYETYARPYSAIYGIVRPIYNNTAVQNFEHTDFQEITPTVANALYDYRSQKIKDTTENYPVSDKIKKKIMALDEKVKKPLVFEYYRGYHRFINMMYSMGVLGGFLIVFLMTPIFCGEYRGSDQLILSSKNGKRSLIKAKLFTGFSLTTEVVILGILLTYIPCMTVYGSDGVSAALQLHIPLSTMPLTMGQLSIICCICVFFACLLVCAITMYLSAKLKTSFLVMTVGGGLVFVPMLIKCSYNTFLLYKLYLLLPSNMMLFTNMIDPLGYEIFGCMIQTYVFMPIVAVVISILLTPFAYKTFKHHQVA